MIHILFTILGILPIDLWAAANLIARNVDPPPFAPEAVMQAIFGWLIKIITAVASVYLVIDIFKHVTSAPRDLGSAGKDMLVMAVLLGVAAQAGKIVGWAMTLFA